MSERKKDSKKDSPQHGSRLAHAIITIFCVLSCACVAVSLIRGNFSKLFFKKDTPSRASAKNWLRYVEENHAKSAALCAGTIIDDSFFEVPNPDYLDLAKCHGLSTVLITGPFSDIDASRWIDAFASAKIAKEIVANCANDSEFPKELSLFFKKKFQVRNENKKGRIPSTLSELLRQKEISVYDAYRLANEISVQAAFEPMVVSLHDEKQNTIHIFLEIKKGTSNATLDFINGLFYENREVQDILKKPTDDMKLRGIIASTKFARYHLAAELSDFKKANSDLREKISKLVPEIEMPRFGISPAERMKTAIKDRSRDNIPPSLFAYWHYPFSLLSQNNELPEIYRLKIAQ
jgi:hypothetical protein